MADDRFCRHIDAALIKPHTTQIIELLLNNTDETYNEPLYLVLETLRAVLAVDKDVLEVESVKDLAEVLHRAWLANATGRSTTVS